MVDQQRYEILIGMYFEGTLTHTKCSFCMPSNVCYKIIDLSSVNCSTSQLPLSNGVQTNFIRIFRFANSKQTTMQAISTSKHILFPVLNKMFDTGKLGATIQLFSP